MAQPTETTTYTLTVEDDSGCMVSDEITITVTPIAETFAPNVFSPNQDGTNDYFTIFTNGSVEQIDYLRIFDRWGNLVFERIDFPPNDPRLGWDGKFNGEFMNPAVFVFVARISSQEGGTTLLKGDVALVK